MNHNNNIDKIILMLGLGLMATHPVAAAVIGAKAIIKVKRAQKHAR